MNRLQMAEQFRRATQIFAASLEDSRALEVATLYPAYQVGRAYQAGELLSYGTNAVGDPQLYRVAQAHTAQEDWPPAGAPALYTPVGLTEAGYPVWSQPSGAHDAYSAGDIVDYNGTLYKSLVDGNVWPPGSAPNMWEIVPAKAKEVSSK